MIDLVIKDADLIVTMDLDRKIVSGGAIAILGDRIIALGKNDQIANQYLAKKTISAKGKIVMPGLVNCHMHTTQQLARGLADGVTQPAWIHERIYPYESHLTPEDAYLSASAACLEMIKTGTTTFADPGGYNMEKVVEATVQSGLRAILARSSMDISTSSRPLPSTIIETTQSVVERAEEFVKFYQGAGNGRIVPAFSLRIVRVCSDELCQRISDLSSKYHSLIEVHASSTKQSIEACKEIFGMTDIERLESLGILGPRVLAIHMNWPTDQEIETVRMRDVKVCHCPTTSPTAGAYGSFAVGKFPEMIRKGILVCLGCDAAACSHFLDMFRVMYQTIYFRDVRLDPFIMPPETVLEMATINGAKALGLDMDIGSLEPGKKADIILVNRWESEFVPCHNPISNLVHACCGHCVSTVLVDGNILMSDRKVQSLDEKTIAKEAQQAAKAVAARAGLDSKALPKWPIL